MKRMLSWATKPAYLAPALLWLIAGVLGLPVTAQGQVDPYQRQIVFYNDLTDKDGNGITIYPLIAAPQAANCNNSNFPPGTSLRILVNDGQEGAGIPPGGSVTVNIPKEQPCPPRGGFYGAVRIIVLLTSVQAFESQFPDALSNQKTVAITAPWTRGICPGCTAGKAAADYGLDAPGQLLEYTIISQINGAKAPDTQNNRAGVPEIDFDVSYVDDVFLPVAMALGDGGATQFMGSGLPYGQLPGIISDFLTMGSGWSSYAVYADPNWGHSILQNLVPLSGLSPRPIMVPSGAQLIAGVRNGSGLYTPSNDNGAYTRQCVDPNMANNPPHNQMCALPPPVGAGLTGDCCPNDNGVILGCCDLTNFLIDQTSRVFEGPPANAFAYSNATFDNLVQRWKQWQGANNPCAPMGPGLTNPATDNQGFCADFKRTVDFIWQDFGAHSTLQPRTKVPNSPFCGNLPQPQQDHCIAENIIGFTNIVSDFNADNCKCPNSDPSLCPDSCNIEALRNDIVQGLLRSVPWTPRGDPSTCGGCPNIDPNVCPLYACVNPNTPSPKATLYDRNKFLHFWAPPSSVYDLDPYVFFVHNSKSVNGPGAYAFSIDDFYGNFGGQGSTLLIDVGGIGHLPNQEPFDPFKQYHAGIGQGWDHAEVCGRTFGRPPAAKGMGPLAAPISFWSNGQPQAECVIRLFPHQSGNEYVAYKLTQVAYQVTDNQTGLMQPVQGLGGAFANRTFPNQQPPPIPPDPYCMANSMNISPAVLMQGGLCNGNLSSAGGRQDYVGVSDGPCMNLKPTDPDYFTCGKPLVNMNLPGNTGIRSFRRPNVQPRP